MSPRSRPFIGRLLDKVEVTNGCWWWTGAVAWNGYGAVRGADGRTLRAHRAVYEVFVGPIPEGLDLDHTCHDPDSCSGGITCPHRRCVNPSHLDPVTRAVNVDRGARRAGRARRDECVKGHPLTSTAGGKRACLVCRRAVSRNYRARKKAA